MKSLALSFLARNLGLAAGILLLTSLVFAQGTNSGAIRGTVTDPTGAVVPGAKITVLNLDTGVSKEYVTNSAGLYDTVSILPGNYRVTFAKEGFNTLARDGVTLQVGAPLTLDGQLTVGSAQQSLQVVAEAQLLKTETAEQATNLSSETIAELPNVGRDWTNMTKTLPGVVGSGGGITANGTMPYYANFLADGIADINPHSANVNYTTFEAIAEVQIATSSFSAMYGTGAVVFNQISKSGSNKWHGSAYEYVQNDVLNSRSFFASSVPIKRYNNFGGAFSGPLVKNKAFFFFNIDKVINKSVSFGFNTFPTAAMKAGNFSDTSYFPTIYDPATLAGTTRQPFPGNLIPTARMDKLALETQKYYADPTLPGYTNNSNPPRHNMSNWLKYFGRADYQIKDSNRLSLSVNQLDNPNYSDDPQCPLNCYTGDVDSYNVQLSDVWTITSALINEMRLGYHREDSNYAQVNLGMGYPAKIGWNYSKGDMFPSISISGTQGSPTGLNTANNNARYAQNTYNPSDTVTWIRGRHVLHFGGEVLLFKDNDTPWGNIQGGNFTFSGYYTAQAPNASRRVGYADYLLGQVQSYSSNNRPINANRQEQYQFFVQDDIKVRPNLTLNLGLRYQTMGGWREKHNNTGTFDPTITNPVTNTLGAMWFAPNNGRTATQKTIRNIILPRLGVAWAARQNWVVRGGFGMFTQPWSQDWYGGGSGLGTAVVCSTSDSTQLTPRFLFSDANPNLNCAQASRDPGAYNGQSVGFFPYDTAAARNFQWSISIQRTFGGLVTEAAYVGNHVINLPFPNNIDQVTVDKMPQAAANSSLAQSLRPYPQYTGVSGTGGYYNAVSNYNSMQLSVRKRFARGMSFDANYTWSKMMSEQDSSGWSGNAGTSYWQNAYLPGVNYGRSNLDRTHLFKADGVYQVPIGKGRSLLSQGGPLDWIAGGWQLSGILQYQSGAPYTPTMNSNNSGALAGSWYPNIIGNPVLASPTINQWFNYDAFAAPQIGTFGGAGRNILVGPRLSSVDFSVAKSFTIPKLENGRLQIKMDSTNILNHTSFSNPNASIGSTGNVGKITGTNLSGRTIQLGARLSF